MKEERRDNLATPSLDSKSTPSATWAQMRTPQSRVSQQSTPLQVSHKQARSSTACSQHDLVTPRNQVSNSTMGPPSTLNGSRRLITPRIDHTPRRSITQRVYPSGVSNPSPSSDTGTPEIDSAVLQRFKGLASFKRSGMDFADRVREDTAEECARLRREAIEHAQPEFTPRTQERFISTLTPESMIQNVIIPSLKGEEPDYGRMTLPLATPLLRMSNALGHQRLKHTSSTRTLEKPEKSYDSSLGAEQGRGAEDALLDELSFGAQSGTPSILGNSPASHPFSSASLVSPTFSAERDCDLDTSEHGRSPPPKVPEVQKRRHADPQVEARKRRSQRDKEDKQIGRACKRLIEEFLEDLPHDTRGQRQAASFLVGRLVAEMQAAGHKAELIDRLDMKNESSPFYIEEAWE